MKKIRGKLTYANVVATLALFIAVGGASAFAATQLGKNSVGSKQIKKNSVTTEKIKNGAVTAAKIKNATITGAQINLGSLGQVPSANVANTANSAVTAESASPAVFAHIEGGGAVDPIRSKGLTGADVKRASAGTYCITVPSFSPRGGQVTPEFEGFAAQSATLTIGGTGFCPAPAVQVVTTKIGASTGSEDMAFYVELYH